MLNFGGGDKERHFCFVTYSHDSRHIISGGLDGIVRVLNADSGVCVSTLEGHESFITSVACSSDGCFIVSADTLNVIRIWDVATGKCLHVLSLQRNLCFDGHLG